MLSFSFLLKCFLVSIFLGFCWCIAVDGGAGVSSGSASVYVPGGRAGESCGGAGVSVDGESV